MKKLLNLILAVAFFGCHQIYAGTDPLPNYPGGILVTSGAPSNGTSAIQTLTFGATITSGTFKLAYKGFTTSAITWSATDATLVANIDAALEALPTLAGGGSVTTAQGTISSGVNGTITITFTGNYAKLLVPAITVADNSLVGAAHTLTCTITTPGVTADGRSAPSGQLLIDKTTPGAYQNASTTLLAPSWTVIPTVSDVLLASAPVFAHGLTASGSDSEDFSGGTGTFKTSSGANTLSGAVSVSATTPSITLATGQTNTGFLSILGKTSGGLKLTVADASAFLVTATLSAQTSGTAALTIPDFAGVADEFTFKTKAQTMANKTLTTPVIATGLTASGSAANDFSGSTGTFLTSTGLSTVGGGLVGSTQALSGAGAVNVTSMITKLTTTGGAQALSLADGTNGQIKIIVHDVDGGSAVLTPTTKTGFSTITFTNVGESATLVFVTTRGWIILALNGAVAA